MMARCLSRPTSYQESRRIRSFSCQMYFLGSQGAERSTYSCILRQSVAARRTRRPASSPTPMSPTPTARAPMPTRMRTRIALPFTTPNPPPTAVHAPLLPGTMMSEAKKKRVGQCGCFVLSRRGFGFSWLGGSERKEAGAICGGDAGGTEPLQDRVKIDHLVITSHAKGEAARSSYQVKIRSDRGEQLRQVGDLGAAAVEQHVLFLF